MRNVFLFGELPASGVPTRARRLLPEDVDRDIQAILWSLKLHSVRRFYRQRYWEAETTDASYADRIESEPKLENVSAHSWHVADIALLLADNFPPLSKERCLSLAIVHDKLEIVTGDYDPIGKFGDGSGTHAFDTSATLIKLSDERRALQSYVSRLRSDIQSYQRELFEELLDGRSREARFVKSVDKLQSLAYVYTKKNGALEDQHLLFTLQYGAKAYQYFPEIRPYYERLAEKVLASVARQRCCPVESLQQRLFGQLELGL